jgi:hypothetical protein|tara:strand:+ start:2175 stop:2915 length:741 start_codon:yes stop_codon:yes gene_type:complete
MDATIAALAAAQIPPARMTLAVVTGEPVALEAYVATYGSIILALEGGQAAGTGFADVLLGTVSPSGMTPFTMYKAGFVDEVKMSDMTLRPNATTGSKGKTYRFYSGDVNWPFGHGLSYTTFSMAWGSTMPPAGGVSAATLQSDGVTVSVDVTNTGAVRSMKIVALYVSTPDVDGSPLRTLVALDKIDLAPGAKQTVVLKTNAVVGICAFCLFDDAGAASVPVGTKYVLDVGDGGKAFFPAATVVAK